MSSDEGRVEGLNDNSPLETCHPTFCFVEPSDLENVHWVIAGAVFGFLFLAFILLFPVYRFLNREEESSRSWTPEEIAHHQPRGDGTTQPEPPEAEPSR